MARTKEEIEQAAAEFEEWAEQLEHDPSVGEFRPTRDLREIAEAVDAIARDEARLAEAVRVARANGRSWARIGVSLGVSKQAAMKRFGEPAVPRQGG